MYGVAKIATASLGTTVANCSTTATDAMATGTNLIIVTTSYTIAIPIGAGLGVVQGPGNEQHCGHHQSLEVVRHENTRGALSVRQDCAQFRVGFVAGGHGGLVAPHPPPPPPPPVLLPAPSPPHHVTFFLISKRTSVSSAVPHPSASVAFMTA